MRGDWYQVSLISLGLILTAFFAVFFYRELAPEYKVYQKRYEELERFRTSYTHEPMPPFEFGVKQILLESQKNGPPIIDRCTSCHVALQFSHFSPTQIARDANGNIVQNKDGIPVQEPNPDYVWGKLDEKIASLQKESKTNEAEKLKALKTVVAGDHVYNATKALQAHPLIGRETRPFEYHPIDEYGCTSCHNGNGRGLTVEKAHGPVFDEDYEAEFIGAKPSFTEFDPANDPVFSRVFNDKPGHELLFQTTPLYVGALLQANCVQCHLSSLGELEKAVQKTDGLLRRHSSKEDAQAFIALSQLENNINDIGAILKVVPSEIDVLTQNFHQGKELYIAEACYACHRISGFARGGVGPELTNAGSSYPWYLKQKIVWPQGDLKTSTMPNFRLDHVDLEDLVTFLLAQHGRGQTSSESAYKADILEWEAGRKMPWEKPINPGRLHDLRYSMTVFATEGCASCHRLKGFKSNVGFKVEADKNTKPDFNTLYNEHVWFSKLFPESIVGSDIVKAIDNNKSEIDKRIIDGVRDDGILEEIETNHPGIIESFYSQFAYAARAKNDFYKQSAAQTQSPTEKMAIEQEGMAWKERVHRLLMMYIQEYGLGRLIGPRPNWSGIYRSDEWLIEHFRKPSQHIPHSIMPVMPFDDTKFYALTYMLDTLAKQNRDAVREIWDNKGFDPALAYSIHCSQCHGEYLYGNGPVSEWIYPIPKNLRNADFLRNFTKDNLVNSIMHGVVGTPMPPWGEVASGKERAFEPPVLKENEIKQLVDWIYSSLLGGAAIRSYTDVPKWQYTPEDVIKEMEREGGKLTPGSPAQYIQFYEAPVQDHSFGIPLEANRYYASLVPTVMKADENVTKIFAKIPNPVPGPETNLYYIKKEYYTHENLLQGQQFFELNCAVCHGKEADGMGYRAGSMYDAKPRMLINLNWIDSRDDLRLLRSIKYGVPGTSMTPWGDLTTSLQRLQLVMYIRSLSMSQIQRDQLFDAIYAVFDEADQTIETARSSEYKQVNELRESLKKAIQKRKSLDLQIEHGTAKPEEAIAYYQEELKLNRSLKQQEQLDEILVKLKDAVKQESQIYQRLGISLIAKSLDGQSFNNFLKLIKDNNVKFSFEEKLQVSVDPKMQEETHKIEAELIQSLQSQIESAQKEKKIFEGTVESEDAKKQLEKMNTELKANIKLKNDMITGFEESSELRKKQLELYNNTFKE